MVMQSQNALTLDYQKDLKIKGIDVYLTKISSTDQSRYSNLYDNEQSKMGLFKGKTSIGDKQMRTN